MSSRVLVVALSLLLAAPAAAEEGPRVVATAERPVVPLLVGDSISIHIQGNVHGNRMSVYSSTCLVFKDLDEYDQFIQELMGAREYLLELKEKQKQGWPKHDRPHESNEVQPNHE